MLKNGLTGFGKLDNGATILQLDCCASWGCVENAKIRTYYDGGTYVRFTTVRISIYVFRINIVLMHSNIGDEIISVISSVRKVLLQRSVVSIRRIYEIRCGNLSNNFVVLISLDRNENSSLSIKENQPEGSKLGYYQKAKPFV